MSWDFHQALDFNGLVLDVSIFSYVFLWLYIGDWTVDIKVSVYVFLTLSLWWQACWKRSYGTEWEYWFLLIQIQLCVWLKMARFTSYRHFDLTNLKSITLISSLRACHMDGFGAHPPPAHHALSHTQYQFPRDCFRWEEAESTWRLWLLSVGSSRPHTRGRWAGGKTSEDPMTSSSQEEVTWCPTEGQGGGFGDVDVLNMTPVVSLVNLHCPLCLWLCTDEINDHPMKTQLYCLCFTAQPVQY